MSKILVFAAFISLAWAQSTTVVTTAMDASSEMPMPSSTVMTPVSTTPVTPMSSPAPTSDLTANSSLAERFNGTQARGIRGSHFYCLNETTAEFPKEQRDSGNQLNPFYWSLMVQYPVLSFLDVRRKENLISIIINLVKRGGPSTNSIQNLMPSDFCIGPVDHYRVSYYEESVLIRFYFRDIVVTPYDQSSGIPISTFNRYFMMGYEQAAMDSGDNNVVRFLGRNALAIDSVRPLGGFISENVHPGGMGLESDEDPTLRAVVISYRPGNVTVAEALAQGNRTQDFANNPRPINYGLEPGDIVFAVFGSIFLAIVGALTVLGFCIHPFFLA